MFGPHDAVYYVWQSVIAIACFYNLVMIVARAGIQEVQKSFRPLWYSIDYICDFIYVLDMLVSSRTGGKMFRCHLIRMLFLRRLDLIFSINLSKAYSPTFSELQRFFCNRNLLLAVKACFQCKKLIII